MSKLNQVKIPVTIDENGDMKLQGWQKEILDQIQMNWKLVRERDELTKQSEKIMWVEWTEEGRFKERHEKPAISRSLIMSPFNNFFTWQTTMITEIVEQRDNYIKFKTQNSNYELFYIGDNSREQ
jgi:hypothetical protein